MTSNTLTMNPLDGGRKLVLLAVCVGLAAMLATSFMYRLSNPSLVQPGHEPGPQEAANSAEMDVVSALMEKVQQNPNDAGALFALGQNFLDHQDWPRAESFLSRTVVASPADPKPLYMLGIAQYQQEKFDKAAETFERLIELDPQPAARYNLGILYRHYLKAVDKGNAHLKAVLDDPKAPEDLKAQTRKELEAPLEAPADTPAGQAAGAQTPGKKQPDKKQ